MPRAIAYAALCTGALLAAFAALGGEVISARPEAVELVIYRHNPTVQEIEVGNNFFDETADDNTGPGLGMVTETRTVDIPAGESTLRFVGTAEGIIPQTAKLEALPAALIESNFNYDLIAPGEIIAKSIDRPVRLVRTEPRSGRVIERKAILRSGPRGVVLEVDGHFEAPQCSHEHEKIVFDEVPPNLTAEPTLAVTVNAQAAGRYRLRLSYLVLGPTWSANYVANIRPDGRQLDLLARITLHNPLSTTFVDASVQAVAGRLAIMDDTMDTAQRLTLPAIITPYCWYLGRWSNHAWIPTHTVTLGMKNPQAWRDRLEEVIVTAQKLVEQSELGDYKLYTLTDPTTVAARQTKQVRFLDRPGVRFERIYTYKLSENDEQPAYENAPSPTTVTLRLRNDKRDGLGVPLPLGLVSVFEYDAQGRPLLVGEQNMADIPVGGPAELRIARAADVWVSPRIVNEAKRQSRGRTVKRADFELQIGNNKSIPVNVEILLPMDEMDEAVRIVDESARHDLHFGRTRWSLALKPGERRLLTFTAEKGG